MTMLPYSLSVDSHFRQWIPFKWAILKSFATDNFKEAINRYDCFRGSFCMHCGEKDWEEIGIYYYLSLRISVSMTSLFHNHSTAFLELHIGAGTSGTRAKNLVWPHGTIDRSNEWECISFRLGFLSTNVEPMGGIYLLKCNYIINV